jgi:hypothetical protein
VTLERKPIRTKSKIIEECWPKPRPRLTSLPGPKRPSGLWVGGRPTPGKVKHDLVVLCSPSYQPEQGEFPERVTSILCPLVDGDLNRDDKWKVVAVAHMVHEALANAQSALITCNQGRNRSALIAATVMIIRGATPSDAIRHVRKKRKTPGVLSNAAFNRFLRQELKGIIEYAHKHGGRPPPELGKGLPKLRLRSLKAAA